jgi:hypothetical protein
MDAKSCIRGDGRCQAIVNYPEKYDFPDLAVSRDHVLPAISSNLLEICGISFISILGVVDKPYMQSYTKMQFLGRHGGQLSCTLGAVRIGLRKRIGSSGYDSILFDEQRGRSAVILIMHRSSGKINRGQDYPVGSGRTKLMTDIMKLSS